MAPLRKLLFVFALATSAFGATGSWNGVAFTGWNGVAQTGWNGTSISCAASGPTNLLFEWHAENTTVTSGSPAGSSVGDTTATANAAVSLSATQVYDGTKALKVSGANDNYAFDWSSSPAIITPTAGTIEFKIYFDTAVYYQSMFDFRVDADNRIWIETDAGGYMSLVHRAGGTESRCRTTFPVLPSAQWLHVKARWDTTAHNGLYLKITCDPDIGEANSGDNGTTALGTWAGASGTVKFGDINGYPGIYYLDDIRIYNEWVVGMEVYYVDPSASASTEKGTTANPFKSLSAAFSGRCNEKFTNPKQIRCRTSGGVADTTRANAGVLGQMVATAACYLDIVAEVGHEASANWDTNKYRLETVFASGAGSGTALNLTQGYTRVRHLQIGVSSQAGQDAACEIFVWTGGETGYVESCLIRGCNSTGYTRGISSITGINVFNTVICDLNSGVSGGEGVKNHGPSYFYNCTIIGGASAAGIDVADSSVSVAKNCYFQGGANAISIGGAGASLTMTTVATSDSTGTSGLRNIAHSTANFVNVTPGSSDYHLVTGSALKDAGTDTHTDSAPFNFTTDIDNETRPKGAAWDIGVDEF